MRELKKLRKAILVTADIQDARDYDDDFELSVTKIITADRQATLQWLRERVDKHVWLQSPRTSILDLCFMLEKAINEANQAQEDSNK